MGKFIKWTIVVVCLLVVILVILQALANDVLNVLSGAFTLILYVYFVYFSVPFFTSVSVLESSKNERENGLYQWAFMMLSYIGYGFYRFLAFFARFIYEKVVSRFNLNHTIGRNLLKLLDIAIFSGTIYLLNLGKQFLIFLTMQAVPEQLETLVESHMIDGAAETLVERLINGIAYWQVGRAVLLGTRDSGGNLFLAILQVIWVCLLIFGINLLIFAVIYGLLVSRMEQIGVIANWDRAKKVLDSVSGETEEGTVAGLLNKLRSAALEIPRQMSYVYLTLQNGSMFFLVIMGSLFISSLDIFNRENIAGAVLSTLFPLEDFAKIILNFLLTYLLAKLWQILNGKIVRSLPETIREKIYALSESALEVVKQIKEKRIKAKANDLINNLNRNSSGGPGHTDGVDFTDYFSHL